MCFFPHSEGKVLVHVSFFSNIWIPKMLFENSVMIRIFSKESLQNMGAQPSPITRLHVRRGGVEDAWPVCGVGLILWSIWVHHAWTAQVLGILWDTKLKSLGTSDMLSYWTHCGSSPSYMSQGAISKDVKSMYQHQRKNRLFVQWTLINNHLLAPYNTVYSRLQQALRKMEGNSDFTYL